MSADEPWLRRQHLVKVACRGATMGCEQISGMRWQFARAPPLLRRYAEMRRADQRRVIALSHGLARLFGNDLCPLVIARDLAMCAIDMIPALKRALVRRAMGFGA